MKNNSMGNPYKSVREKVKIHMEGDVKCIETICYDRLNREVGESCVREYADGRKGHCARYVESDGYWHGGAGEERPDGTYMEALMQPYKFEEE